MKLQKLAVIGGLVATGLLGTVAVQRVDSDDATGSPDREAYEAMLAAHPFNTRPHLTPTELRAIPKRDRPDLAAEQDFLLTMDPATGTVPRERLWEADRVARDLQRAAEARGGGPLVTEAWEERGPTNVGGRTRALMFDPNDPTGKKAWAGGVAGGLWYNDDVTSLSSSWNPVNDFWANLAVVSIAYDPTDTQVMYAGTGEGYFNLDAVRGAGIFKTTDGGATWDLLPATQTSSFYFTMKLAVHPTTGDVYAATGSGIFRSQDDGDTWELVQAGQGRDVDIAADGTIYATVIGRVYASTTGDTGSWAQLNNGTNGFPSTGVSRIEVAPAPSNAQVVYALAATSCCVQGLYRSADAGATWTPLARPVDADSGIGNDFTRGQAWYDLTIAVDPNDEDVAFVGGIDIFKTTNGGSSWQQVTHWYGGFGFQNVHADQHNIVFKEGSSDVILFSNDGGVYFTASGSTAIPPIEKRNKDYNVTQFYAGAIAPEDGSDVMLAGAQDNGTQRYSRPGASITSEARGGDGAFTFIDQTQSSIAIASYVYNNFYKSTNGGVSFPTTLISDGGTGSFVNPAD